MKIKMVNKQKSVVEKTNYKELISQLSSAYEIRGRPAHDELLASFKEDIGEIQYSILNQAVVKEYLERKGADRLFGAFPEEALFKLTKRCQELEEIF